MRSSACGLPGKRPAGAATPRQARSASTYCLLFLSPALLRYLMIHELSHAQHMNHSSRFWRLVARHEPNYRRLDKQLSGAWKDIPTWVGLY